MSDFIEYGITIFIIFVGNFKFVKVLYSSHVGTIQENINVYYKKPDRSEIQMTNLNYVCCFLKYIWILSNTIHTF